LGLFCGLVGEKSGSWGESLKVPFGFGSAEKNGKEKERRRRFFPKGGRERGMGKVTSCLFDPFQSMDCRGGKIEGGATR